MDKKNHTHGDNIYVYIISVQLGLGRHSLMVYICCCHILPIQRRAFPPPPSSIFKYVVVMAQDATAFVRELARGESKTTQKAATKAIVARLVRAHVDGWVNWI